MDDLAMFSWVVGFLIIGVGVMVLYGIVRWATRNDRRDSLASPELPPLAKIPEPTADERAVGAQRAAEGAGAHEKQPYVELFVSGREGMGEGRSTYLAAYELIVRGIDTRLEMQETFFERGEFNPWSTVVSRVAYTTEAFIPHLPSIKSIDDFEQYAPYRPDYDMVLLVHPADLDDAYQVLRDLNIPLSPLHHPDQP